MDLTQVDCNKRMTIETLREILLLVICVNDMDSPVAYGGCQYLTLAI